MALATADSVVTTANEASIVKITSPAPSTLPPSTDGSLAGAATASLASAELDMLQDDAIELSDVASLTRPDDAADVDLEKVAALRQAIGNGSFQIDPESIYTSLMADAREMLGSAPT